VPNVHRVFILLSLPPPSVNTREVDLYSSSQKQKTKQEERDLFGIFSIFSILYRIAISEKNGICVASRNIAKNSVLPSFSLYLYLVGYFYLSENSQISYHTSRVTSHHISAALALLLYPICLLPTSSVVQFSGELPSLPLTAVCSSVNYTHRLAPNYSEIYSFLCVGVCAISFHRLVSLSLALARFGNLKLFLFRTFAFLSLDFLLLLLRH